MEQFKNLIAEALSPLTPNGVKPSEIETPPDRNRGDFAYPCFRLSKELKLAPPAIAASLAEKLKSNLDLTLLTVETAGPYLNFSMTEKAIERMILAPLLSPEIQFGKAEPNSKLKWVFEFSSPNVAKPFQIYHLRTTIVGAALSKIARYRGYQVTTINHLGDWGTQYGKLAIALKRYAKELPEALTLKHLVDIYVRIHKDMETDPEIEKAGQDAFRKLEAGDPEMRAIWKKCVDISLKEFEKTYARYQVSFDHYWGESFYEEQLKPLLSDLKAKKILIEDQGAWVVPVQSRDGHEIPPCILEKSDGASIYATRDVAAALYRKKHLDFERMSYIVGKEQKLHFEQVFGVLRALKCDWEKDCEHIATGLYRFKDAKMSTRKGNFITLEEVNELCVEKSLKLMSDRAQSSDTNSADSLTADEIQKIADQVSIGALVFADLSTDPTRDLEFDVDRVISFEGETGPYLQYAHTRAQSILRKSGMPRSAIETLHSEQVITKLQTLPEKNLLRMLGRFPEALDRTLETRKPSQLTSYLFDLTQDFGLFYRECKVMNPDDRALTEARLALVLASQKVIAIGLDLLGIPKPERM